MVSYTNKEFGGKSTIVRKYNTYQTMNSNPSIRIKSPQLKHIKLKFKETQMTSLGFGFFFNYSFLKYDSYLLMNIIKYRREVFILMNNLLIYNEELLVILQKIIINEYTIDDRIRLRWLINEISINTALYLNNSLIFRNTDWSLQVYFEYIDYLQSYVINTETYDCDEFRKRILSFCNNYKITIDDVKEARKQFFIFYKLF